MVLHGTERFKGEIVGLCLSSGLGNQGIRIVLPDYFCLVCHLGHFLNDRNILNI